MIADNIDEQCKQFVLHQGWKQLELSFFMREDVVTIARELLGKILVTCFNSIFTAARIAETEAYNGITDKASHAFDNRRTNRTEVMYASGGVAYVYLCYGIHYLFNVVTNVADTPHTVLIRAAEPLIGIEKMLLRTGKNNVDYSLTKGPGNVSKAMGITLKNTGNSLAGNELFIADDNYTLKDTDIITTKRIGVNYAGDDALLSYRFFIKNNFYVSGKPILNAIAGNL